MSGLQGEVTERWVSSSEVEYDEAEKPMIQPLAVVVEGASLRCSVVAAVVWRVHTSTSV